MSCCGLTDPTLGNKGSAGLPDHAWLVCRGEPDQEFSEKLKQAMAQKADDLVKRFQEDWSEVMENMAEAEDAFDDLSGAFWWSHFRLNTGLCCSQC